MAAPGANTPTPSGLSSMREEVGQAPDDAAFFDSIGSEYDTSEGDAIMSSIKAAVEEFAEERSGGVGFYKQGITKAGQTPHLRIPGIDDWALPPPPAALEQFRKLASASPFGRGAETVVDAKVRHSVELQPSQFTIENIDAWNHVAGGILLELARELGAVRPVTGFVHKLLLYEPGGHFDWHVDTPKVPGMFATLVVVLPLAHTGGQLEVRAAENPAVVDDDVRAVIDSAGTASSLYDRVEWVGFLSSCQHRVHPVLTGQRLALVYNVAQTNAPTIATPPVFVHGPMLQRFTASMRAWAADHRQDSTFLTLGLQHPYAPVQFRPSFMLGYDAHLLAVVTAAAHATGCTVLFATLQVSFVHYPDDEDTLEMPHTLQGTVTHVATMDGVLIDNVQGTAVYPAHCYPTLRKLIRFREADNSYGGHYTGNYSADITEQYSLSALLVVASRLGGDALLSPKALAIKATSVVDQAKTDDEHAQLIVAEVLRHPDAPPVEGTFIVCKLGDVTKAKVWMSHILRHSKYFLHAARCAVRIAHEFNLFDSLYSLVKTSFRYFPVLSALLFGHDTPDTLHDARAKMNTQHVDAVRCILDNLVELFQLDHEALLPLPWQNEHFIVAWAVDHQPFKDRLLQPFFDFKITKFEDAKWWDWKMSRILSIIQDPADIDKPDIMRVLRKHWNVIIRIVWFMNHPLPKPNRPWSYSVASFCDCHACKDCVAFLKDEKERKFVIIDTDAGCRHVIDSILQQPVTGLDWEIFGHRNPYRLRIRKTKGFLAPEHRLVRTLKYEATAVRFPASFVQAALPPRLQYVLQQTADPLPAAMWFLEPQYMGEVPRMEQPPPEPAVLSASATDEDGDAVTVPESAPTPTPMRPAPVAAAAAPPAAPAPAPAPVPAAPAPQQRRGRIPTARVPLPAASATAPSLVAMVPPLAPLPARNTRTRQAAAAAAAAATAIAANDEQAAPAPAVANGHTHPPLHMTSNGNAHDVRKSGRRATTAAAPDPSPSSSPSPPAPALSKRARR